MIIEPTEIKSERKPYICELFNYQRPDDPVEDRRINIIERSILTSEAERPIKKIKNGEAPDPDGIYIFRDNKTD